MRVGIGMASFMEVKSWNISEMICSGGLSNKCIWAPWGTGVRKRDVNLSSTII